jgi:hypothetical protein
MDFLQMDPDKLQGDALRTACAAALIDGHDLIEGSGWAEGIRRLLLSVLEDDQRNGLWRVKGSARAKQKAERQALNRAERGMTSRRRSVSEIKRLRRVVIHG